MTGAELREAWPSLAPRERDARVGEAMGREVVEVAGRFYFKPDPDAPNIPGWGVRHDLLPYYSTSWSDAGSLLDKLREEGWRVTFYWSDRGAGVALSRTGAADSVDTDHRDTAQSAIALAFCLSRCEAPRE